jgi:hypothetical protein
MLAEAVPQRAEYAHVHSVFASSFSGHLDLRPYSRPATMRDADRMEVRCQNCGVVLRINAWQQPLNYETRPASPFGPATFVVIGNGWLVHRCVLG